MRKTLSKVVGMFAFACLDEESGTFYLARDRFGEKPLYVQGISADGLSNDIYFGSELAIFGFNNPQTETNAEALDALFKFGFTVKNTILANVDEVIPGEFIEIKFNINR